MSEPIVFITHHKLKEGKLGAFREMNQEALQRLEQQKPATLAQLAYLGEDSAELSFIHLFPDAQAMDLHFEGVQERAKQAYEFMQPLSMEIYGSPSDAVLERMKQIAESGVAVRIDTENLGGFLRLQSA